MAEGGGDCEAHEGVVGGGEDVERFGEGGGVGGEVDGVELEILNLLAFFQLHCN